MKTLIIIVLLLIPINAIALCPGDSYKLKTFPATWLIYQGFISENIYQFKVSSPGFMLVGYRKEFINFHRDDKVIKIKGRRSYYIFQVIKFNGSCIKLNKLK